MTLRRVTQRSMAQHTLTALQANISRLGQIQRQLSSGRQISKPSDSPTGTVTAMQFRSQIRTNEQWSRNAADGIGWLSTLDQTTSASIESAREARNLTLQALKGGASSPEAGQEMAAVATQIRAGMLALANTTYLDRPVFGGTTSGPVAYDANGVYQGNPAPAVPPVPGASTGVTRAVGADASVRVDQTGPEVFGPNGANLFTTLDNIAARMAAGDTVALRIDLTDLDTAMTRMQRKLAEVGAGHNMVQQMQKAADDRVLTLKSSLSEIENIDLPKTIVELQMQQVAYSAALGATPRIITTSLADFLR